MALARTALVALAAAAAANALFLQSGPHPAPLFATDEAAGSVEPQEPRALVTTAQEELQQAGYYEGRVDGIAGPQTEAAIVAFERAAGYAVTGEVSPGLVEAIRSWRRGSPPSGGGGPTPDRVVAAVQVALSQAAYGPLPADGIFGPQTREAIRRFQADHGLPVTGELSDSLVVELRAVGILAEE